MSTKAQRLAASFPCPRHFFVRRPITFPQLGATVVRVRSLCGLLQIENLGCAPLLLAPLLFLVSSALFFLHMWLCAAISSLRDLQRRSRSSFVSSIIGGGPWHGSVLFHYASLACLLFELFSSSFPALFSLFPLAPPVLGTLGSGRGELP
jgi:hypothetical protein